MARRSGVAGDPGRMPPRWPWLAMPARWRSGKTVTTEFATRKPGPTGNPHNLGIRRWIEQRIGGRGRGRVLPAGPTAPSGKNPSATPAADPLLDPPGVCRRLCGLPVGPGLRVANSVVTVLPITTAPAARAQATGAASARGCQPRQIGEPYSLGISAVSSTSFTPIGRPCSGPGRAPAALGVPHPHRTRRTPAPSAPVRQSAPGTPPSSPRTQPAGADQPHSFGRGQHRRFLHD